ncbi:MAG: 3-deoxy-7-phosphoheptulonate synthase, partial [Candidatus Acidiferrales bacterium]
MIINMAVGATEEQIEHVVKRIEECGFNAHLSRGEERTVIGVVGKSEKHRGELEALQAAAGVEEIIRVSHPFKLASRNFRPAGSVIELGDGVTIGGPEIVAAAGPCAVESAAQIGEIAERVARAGAKLLRGGAFKPRSSPYSFQGMGEDGLKLLRAAADRNGLLVISEVMDPSQIEVMLPYVDVLQVGARNMQNYFLLRALGEIQKPVLLKRGMSATIEELLLSAEYIMAGGNYNVVLCERGIRTFDTYMRNTMDIAAIPVIKQLSHLPVVADPSHGTGRRDKVAAMARASVAAGADGLLIEVHQ